MTALGLNGSSAGESRLEDYLDDKLQTFADFETLDALLANVKSQQQLLKTQLEDAQRDVATAEADSQRHASAIKGREAGLEKDKEDINKRKMALTRSETSEAAAARFDPIMRKLRRLDVANGQVNVLMEVQRLADETVSKIHTDPDASLAMYAQLRGLLIGLKSAQEDAEDAAPHLVDQVERSCQSVRASIKDVLVRDLEVVLKKILWPKPGVNIPTAFQEGWEIAMKRLLALQKPELQADEEENQGNSTPAVLLPLETMARPLEQRFRYHFDGDRPTNRLDKPEYFFSHITDLLNSHAGFMSDFVQPVLLEAFKHSSVADDPAYIDAILAFITALLPILKRKLFSLVPQVAKQPELLSHLMHELLSFDQTLRDEWQYYGNDSSWRGLTHEVLVHQDWFAQWLQVEKDFALARYQSIVDTPDSFALDYESLEPSATKPTSAAIRVKDLLETVTETYRRLDSFSQKLRFLIDIQLSIFDRFHARLHSSLEAFLSMTSSLGRTVQGVSAADAANLQGVKGLDRLCRVFGSADYLERALREWSDDVFFLDLWSELQQRAASGAGRSANLVAGPLSLAEVASKTSATLGSRDDDEADDGEASGALFDETAGAYARLRSRSEAVIVETVTSSAREAMRAYTRSNPWASMHVPAAGNVSDAETAPSPELVPALDVLATNLAFLSRALASLPLRRISRQVAKALDAYVFDRVLSAHSFSTRGARQVQVDVDGIGAVIGRHAGGLQDRRGLRRCTEGARLLALPVRGQSRGGPLDAVDNADDADAAWDVQDESRVDENGAEATGEQSRGRGAASLGLWDVEKRLFASNESARDVLDELGIETISESEARHMLQRRVELAS